MEFITIVIYLSIYIGLITTTFFILSFMDDKKKKKLFFNDDELPFVSVIIPAYNEEKSIAGTIESILKSDYPKDKFEVIVINDGSNDNTLKVAKKFEKRGVRVLSKKNGGKGNALNFGIDKAKGEIIFSMDADTFVASKSVKNMVRYFKNERVMSVTPAMIIHKPKSILQRVQYVEYLTGIFLRKAFASLDAVYLSPGAFSAYRKSFFDKYGGYDENDITEDLELGLRIQVNGYIVENCIDAPAYTIAPRKFKELLLQRRRWYIGLIKDTWKHRKIFGRKYGDLGMFVFPSAWLGICFALIVVFYYFFKIISEVKEELLFLNAINFDVSGLFNINFYLIERALFLFFTNPIVIFIFIFMLLVGFYIHFAAKKIGKSAGRGTIYLNLPLFFLLFALLFGFWWIVSIIHGIFSKKVKWK